MSISEKTIDQLRSDFNSFIEAVSVMRSELIEAERELTIWSNEDIPCPHQVALEEKLAAFRLEVFEEAAKALDTISIHAGGKHDAEAANYGIKVSASVIRRIAKTYRDEPFKKCHTCGKKPCECKDDPEVGYFVQKRGLDDGPPNSIIKY